jgi:hypothetical protein
MFKQSECDLDIFPLGLGGCFFFMIMFNLKHYTMKTV